MGRVPTNAARDDRGGPLASVSVSSRLPSSPHARTAARAFPNPVVPSRAAGPRERTISGARRRDASPAGEPWCAPPADAVCARIRTPPSPPPRRPRTREPGGSPRRASLTTYAPRPLLGLASQSFFGLGKAVTVDVTFTGGERQRTASVKTDGGAVDTAPRSTSGDTLSGHVHLSPAPGKRVDHLGVKVEILGQIELSPTRGNAHGLRLPRPRTRPPGGTPRTALHPVRVFRASNSRTRRTRASTFASLFHPSHRAAPVRKLGGVRDAVPGSAQSGRRAGDQQQHQDGSWHRRLSAYRVRVRQGEVPPSRRGGGKDLLPVGAHQDQTHGG